MDAIPIGTEEVDRADCWTLLRRTVIGRFAVIVDARPVIFPVNFVVDHGSVVIRTDVGSKLSGALHGPVCFEVDGYDAADETAWSVIIKGLVEQIREKDEVLDAMSLPLVPWQSGRKPRFLRIIPEETTGRRVHIPLAPAGPPNHSRGTRLTSPRRSPPTCPADRRSPR